MRLILTLFILLCARVTARASLPSQSPLRPRSHLSPIWRRLMSCARAVPAACRLRTNSVLCFVVTLRLFTRASVCLALYSLHSRARLRLASSGGLRALALLRRSVSTCFLDVVHVSRRPMRLMLDALHSSNSSFCARVTARASLPSQLPLRPRSHLSPIWRRLMSCARAAPAACRLRTNSVLRVVVTLRLCARASVWRSSVFICALVFVSRQVAGFVLSPF